MFPVRALLIFSILLVIFVIASTVDHFFLKPYWFSDSSTLLDNFVFSLFAMRYSRNFPKLFNKHIGLYLVAVFLLLSPASLKEPTSLFSMDYLIDLVCVQETPRLLALIIPDQSGPTVIFHLLLQILYKCEFYPAEKIGTQMLSFSNPTY